MNLEELVRVPDDPPHVPTDPARDALALALVMAERSDDADAVADQILAAYSLNLDALKLMTNLATLVALERDSADEFLYDLALRMART